MTTPMSLHSGHNKFSSLSNTTVVKTFPNLCLWRRSFMLKLAPEKLYRVTLQIFACGNENPGRWNPEYCRRIPEFH